MNRIDGGEPLKTIDKPRQGVASAGCAVGRPFEVFKLLRCDGEPYQHPHARLIEVAGMLRHLAIELLKHDPPDGVPADWLETFVAGHRKEEELQHGQFSYLPLPSIGREDIDAQVCRVMLAGPCGVDDHLRRLAELLDGQRLKPEGGGIGPILLRIEPDGVARQYLNESTAWASVTPVILPGRDDRRATKTHKLIEKALRQSGVDPPCEVEWSSLPFFRNALSAHKYDRQGRFAGYHRPDHLKPMTAIHVRLGFSRPVAGPLAIGSGRHCGLGVFAGVDWQPE
jgi:CRISPR-associated protein Csb2